MNVPEEKVHHAGELTEPDQWTLTQARQLPLYKMTVDGPDRTELYVSPQLAEVVQVTTRGSRVLAWVSTIPHFLYFVPLRLTDGLWQKAVTWTSGLACVLALLGIALGIVQFRRSRYNRPLWDVGVILLSLGGTALSGIGLFIGLKRLRRGVHRASKSLSVSSS